MPTDELTYLIYLTYLTYLVIITKEVKLVKEVISCDVLPVAMFGIIKLMLYDKVGSFLVYCLGSMLNHGCGSNAMVELTNLQGVDDP